MVLPVHRTKLKHAERTFSEKLRFEQCSADLDKVPDFLGSQARFHHLPLCSAQVQPTLAEECHVGGCGWLAEAELHTIHSVTNCAIYQFIALLSCCGSGGLSVPFLVA